uniref:Putative portal protein n=1 Tax=viral metagenome TaxID=1070528 RepID=A0A6H1ZD85_9ZZZZ
MTKVTLNWFQSLFVKAAVRTGSFRFVPEWVRATFLPVSLRRLLDGYRKNSAVAACVTTLAFSFPEAPLLAGSMTSDGRFVADYGHPMMQLLRQPNPDMGDVELMQFAITYASIGGNLYLWKQRAVNGKVIAVWPFSDVNVTPIPGGSTAEGFVKEYQFDAGDGKKIPVPKSEMIHWKWMPDPEQPARGIGAIEFAIRDSDRDMEASAYIYALLKNNAVPPVVVTMAEGDELTPKKAARLRKEWQAKMGGDQRGSLAFLEFGMKAEKMGFDLQQLAGEALNAVPEARIAAAFRVPPVVAGLSVGLKRSDYGDQAARRAFTELTLSALWRSLASELRNGLKDDFGVGTNFQLQFDMRQVRALQEEESKRWERVTLAFNRSLLTRGQAKQELGMEAGRGDEVFFVSLATEFIPAGEAVERTTTTNGKTNKRTTNEETNKRTPNEETNTQRTGTRKRIKTNEQIKASGEMRQEKATAGGAALRRVRLDVARRMGQAVAVYYSQLADRVVERAESGKQKAEGRRQKALPDAEDLINATDNATLKTLVKRFFVEVLMLSWETWNYSLGVELAFDLEDPLVTAILRTAGTRVKLIQEETLSALREALSYGSEHGWSIDDLVRGDAEAGIRGLREIVDETYQDRARTIARTELGEAQNQATAQRYRDAGVGLVEILDDGLGDDDEPCIEANGQIWTLEYFAAHSLEHPNCTRAAAPYFGDAEPDKG